MWAGVQDTHEAHGPPSFRFLMASAWFMQAGTTMLLWSGHKSHHIPSAGGEGNGNPLHYSCLENPMDRGAWRAILQEVAKGQTQLKWLSVYPPRAGVANHTHSLLTLWAEKQHPCPTGFLGCVINLEILHKKQIPAPRGLAAFST